MEPLSTIDSVVFAIKQRDLDELKSVVNSIPTENVSEVLSDLDIYGDTPLNRALDMNDESIVKFLLENCHVNPLIRDGESRYSLTIAAAHNNLEIAKMLLASGATLNSFDDKNYRTSPLYEACCSFNWEMARFLIEQGANIDKSKCLIISAYNFCEGEFVKYLLDCGADVNVKKENGGTILYVCCLYGDMEILKIIVEKGADHTIICGGYTPLQTAAMNNHENIINYYSDKDFYTREEVCDCFELLGVESIRKKDLASAINFWNKALELRSGAIDFESSFFGTFQRNFKTIENYDHLIDDIENSVINSLIIVERQFGINHAQYEAKVGELSKFISIMNYKFWESIFLLMSKLSESRNYFKYITFYNFHNKFIKYAKNLQFKNIDSSVLNLFYELMNGCLNYDASNSSNPGVYFMNSIHKYLVKDIICLYSIKENVKDFDTKWLHTIINSCLNINTSHCEESVFHTIPKKVSYWEFPERLIFEAFEYCCKLSESVNYMNFKNQTPLYSTLYDAHYEFVDILLNYGALTDTKDRFGHSIRDLANHVGRDDMCVGSSSLQILVLDRVKFRTSKARINNSMPAILKSLIRFH